MIVSRLTCFGKGCFITGDKMPNEATLSIENTFVMVSIEDLQRLQEHKASGLVMRTWLALRSFMWGNKRTAFPSLKSIALRMGYDTNLNYEQTIGKALRWLESHKFIARKHKTSKERFTLLRPELATEPNSSPDLSEPNSSEKQNTKTNKFSPLNLPSQAKGAKRQKVRATRRRKRLRKQDLRHIEQVAKEQRQEQQAKQQAIAEYKQAQEKRSQTLQDLLDEYQSNDKPKTPKQAQRAFTTACILHYFDWIDTLPSRPSNISRGTIIEHHDKTIWCLRLNIFHLWEHIQKHTDRT